MPPPPSPMEAAIAAARRVICGRPPTTTERLFTKHYARHHASAVTDAARTVDAEALPPPGTPSGGADVCICRHSNGICVVTLSELHPLVRSRGRVSDVDFRDVKVVTGKKKRGGTLVEAGTKLARITTAGGLVYSVRAGVRGTLVEVNPALAASPQLAVEEPAAAGYLAVVMPTLHHVKTAVDHLLGRDAYLERLLREERGVPEPVGEGGGGGGGGLGEEATRRRRWTRMGSRGYPPRPSHSPATETVLGWSVAPTPPPTHATLW
ncbi:hypothetical protein BU14_0151s0008 [Porphyra umbilicalis]|uniref:Protein Abitram n=1 Tax=Porphyra umbilicalis TaxID=2786 RepID=A0A1X6P9E5_PORUM|nr:hypothetical protein BU14_0151s0008 [Porphyra umbilicalis]|eukprot:OSX77366.1 hypothetical protein BU14_0151s0008 [Porphyra umbilicalis]